MSYVDNGDDELDYEDEEYPESGPTYPPQHAGGAIAALADDEMEEEEEEDYEDLYQDVDVGFFGNSGATGPQEAGRFAENGQNGGGEGYGEEEYAEEYEGVARNRAGEEEGYAEEEEEEEQAYGESGEPELAQSGRNVTGKIEADYELEEQQQQQGEEFAEEPMAEQVLEHEVKEEEVDELEEDDIPEEEDMAGEEEGPAAPVEADVKPSVAASRPHLQQSDGNEEIGRSAEYGTTRAPGSVSGGGNPRAVKSEERDFGEEDSQAGRGAGIAATLLAKPKVEPKYTAPLQAGKPAADRPSKGGAWANGSTSASNEGGTARGGGIGATGPWPATSSRGAGASGPTAVASMPAVAVAAGTAPQAAVAVAGGREMVAASAGGDYGSSKHGASQHQHEAGGIMLFVGELHWWTTDAELEAALSEYGRVKNLKFFEEKASGRSKGYCQVEFYEAGAARVCKEKMDGRVFNDRPCVVAFASPQTIKQMGAAQVGKNQVQGHGSAGGPGRGRGDSGQGGRGGGGGGGGGGPAGAQMGDGSRGYGREKMPMGGRGGGGPGERGRGSGRGRGGGNIGGRGGGGGGGAHFGQGPPGPMGGGPGVMMPPQGMMGGGFDPAFGPGPMGGRGGGGYGMGPVGPGGGFGPRAHPFGAPNMGPPFAAMGPGLPGVQPHVNPAFFGRANGNGPGIGMDGPAGGWGDGPMPGWVGDEHERRMVYGEEMGGPDYGYPGEMGPDRLRPGPARERDRGGEGDWTGVDRRRREDRGDGEWGGERHRERGTRDEFWDREQGREKDKDWPERERMPRGREKSRSAALEDEERPRSRDEDFGKRRRMLADRKIDR